MKNKSGLLWGLSISVYADMHFLSLDLHLRYAVLGEWNEIP